MYCKWIFCSISYHSIAQVVMALYPIIPWPSVQWVAPEHMTQGQLWLFPSGCYNCNYCNSHFHYRLIRRLISRLIYQSFCLFCVRKWCKNTSLFLTGCGGTFRLLVFSDQQSKTPKISNRSHWKNGKQPIHMDERQELCDVCLKKKKRLSKSKIDSLTNPSSSSLHWKIAHATLSACCVGATLSVIRDR